jgi:hypothetical protein
MHQPRAIEAHCTDDRLHDNHALRRCACAASTKVVMRASANSTSYTVDQLMKVLT